MAGPKVLCVDDRVDSLSVRKLLLEQFGCEVEAVTDASSCFDSLAQNLADVVIIDYHLIGEMDGEAVARALRSIYPTLALIMLTGDPKVPDSAKDSVDLLLIKGVSNPRDLLDAIQQLVPKAELRTRSPRFVPGASPRAS